MQDITVDHLTFRSLFVPSYFDYIMTRQNVYLLRDSSIIDPMQKIWNKIFKCNAEHITLDCAIKFVVRHFPFIFRKNVTIDMILV